MSEPSLTPRGEATRRRIMEAATDEFSQHGIAGARVDRISEVARTNKAQLYGYFGNKDGLFDAVFRASLERIVNVVPLDPDGRGVRGAADLADWAVRLYDEYLARPDLIRLATWTRLERRSTGHLVPDPDRLDDAKVRAIEAAQEAGTVRPDPEPFDVMAMVIAMSMTWSPVSNVYAATADEHVVEHEYRRTFLRAVVERAFAP